MNSTTAHKYKGCFCKLTKAIAIIVFAFFSIGELQSQSFTASWPFTTNLNATTTGAITANNAIINAPLFYTSTAFSATGLTGTGTGGKDVSSCTANYTSVGSTPITPYIEYKVSPLAGNYLTIAPFSFTASSAALLSSGMSIAAAYSLDGGLTFTGLTFTTLSIGAVANLNTTGSVFSTTNATLFTISSLSTMTLPTNTDFIIRIIYWRKNITATSANPITLSSLNLIGFSCSGTLIAAPSSLSNFNTIPTAASPSQSFSVGGTTLLANVNVSPPAGYEINNPAVDGNYYSSITLLPIANTLALTPLNIRIKSGMPSAVYRADVLISSSNAPTQIVSLSGASYINYYYNGIEPLATLSSWGTNTDGTGANPPDFGSSTYAQAFYIVNTTNVSTTAPWTIGSFVVSSGNRLVLGNGSSAPITFTMTAGNSLKIGNSSKFNVLAPSVGSNEIIFQDLSSPIINSPDISTNLTYANGSAAIGVSGSNYNTLKITNNTSITLSTTPDIKYLIIDSGSSLIASSSFIITLSAGGNAIINGTIVTARSQGVFSTTSGSKGTIYSADTSATITFGCNATVIYNRGSASVQTISPLNYANIIISNSSDTVPTVTTAAFSGIARIDGQLSFSGALVNTFIINSGALTFGLNATMVSTNGSLNFNNLPVTLESNSPSTAGISVVSVANTAGVTIVNVVGTASAAAGGLCSGKNTLLTLTGFTGTIQWQQSLDNSTWTNIAGATSSTYTTPNLTLTTYYRATVTKTVCTSKTSNVVPIAINSKTWDGTIWDGDGLAPLATESIVMNGNFISTTNIIGCNCTINGGSVIFNTGHTLTLDNALNVVGGSIAFLNGASLVQVTNTVNTSPITYNRDTKPVRRLDYTYWSSPVTPQTLFNVSPLTLSDKYYAYDSGGSKWINENPANTMTSGKGYIIRGPQTYDTVIPAVYGASFVGVPNNGTISAPIIGPAGKVNLLGNPYPSAINAELLYEDNAAVINPNFYFWTHNTPITNNSYTANDYAIYNAVLGAGIGTGLSAVSGGSAPDQFVDAAQAFFVEANGADGTLLFNNTHRVAGSNNSFYRHKNSQAIAEGVKQSPKIWLNLTNDSGLFKQQLIAYVAGATNGYDALYDAKEFNGNPAASFYSMTNDTEKYAIQSRAYPLTIQDVVPLGYTASLAGVFSISLDHFDGLFTEQEVFLVDAETGTFHNLKWSSYSFATAAGTFNNRFEIQYAAKTLHTVTNEMTKNSILVSSYTNIISIKTLSSSIHSITIVDVLGRKIYAQKEINTTTFELDKRATTEIVILCIQLNAGAIISKKIVW